MFGKKAVFATVLVVVLASTGLLVMVGTSMMGIDGGATEAQCTADRWLGTSQISFSDTPEPSEMGTAMCGGGCGFNDCISTPDSPPAGNT